MSKLTTDQLAHNAKIANDEHRMVIQSSQTGLQHAMAAGVALNANKDSVGHGEWEKWLRQNCPDISPETARLYMRLATKSPEIEAAAEQNGNAVADLSIRGARKLISKPGRSRPPKAPKEPASAPKQRPPFDKELAEYEKHLDELCDKLVKVFDEDSIQTLAELLTKRLEDNTPAKQPLAQLHQ